MNVNLTPNITGKNVNIIKGATQADLTNAVNNSKMYRDESQAFSIVSENKFVESAYSALNASVSATTASDKATIATTKANEANNSAINASASETVCIAKATIATDKADIATAQSVIATDKANEASVSANTATTQAGIATTKASEASTSASNALTSENNADTSEANALIYRNQAESFVNSINPSDLVHISGTETITGNKTFSGTVSGLTKATVGLSNVDNTSDANKPISNAVQTALDLKADKATTLGGYGITDAYTKTSTDSLIDIHSKTAKTTLVDADEFMTADSTSSWGLKKITWASIKTLLANLFIPKVTSTDNAIVRFNGTTGDVQNSGVIIDDSGKMTITYSDSSYLDGLRICNTANSALSQAKLYVMNNNNDYVSLIKNSTALGGHSMIYSTGNSPLVFDISGAERMRVHTSGNVGIGTATDNGVDKLQVNGNITASGSIRYNDINNIAWTASPAGLDTLDFYVNSTNAATGDVMEITCVFNHYGILDYGCVWKGIVANGQGGLTSAIIINNSSVQGGSFSITRINSTQLKITKNAGTYSGGGMLMVKVSGTNISKGN